MKALRYRGARDIRHEGMDDPELLSDGDAIVRMTGCSICGSDLHIYHGHGFTEETGYCVGHEAVGEVVEVGRDVRRFRPGDRVMLAASVKGAACGACAACRAGLDANCARRRWGCYGIGDPALSGCQAEAVLVPRIDGNAARIPDGISPDQALLLTDNLPTAYMGAKNADVGPGRTVAVVGLGPIGLMAVESALALGAARVFAIDLVPERRAMAAALGAEAVDADDPVAFVKDATDGALTDGVIEGVGSDATIDLALALAGRGGTVSAFGVNQNQAYRYPLWTAFNKALTFRVAGCMVQEHWPELIAFVRSGRLRPERFITHRMPLSAGAEGYDLFDRRADGVLKVVLEP
jgi:threonine dehydrogenase-like Zn-dependent dehydrogenase